MRVLVVLVVTVLALSGLAILWWSSDLTSWVIYMIGEERALGIENVYPQADGSKLLTNPGAMRKWQGLVCLFGLFQIFAAFFTRPLLAPLIEMLKFGHNRSAAGFDWTLGGRYDGWRESELNVRWGRKLAPSCVWLAGVCWQSSRSLGEDDVSGHCPNG